MTKREIGRFNRLLRYAVPAAAVLSSCSINGTSEQEPKTPPTINENCPNPNSNVLVYGARFNMPKSIASFRLATFCDGTAAFQVYDEIDAEILATGTMSCKGKNFQFDEPGFAKVEELIGGSLDIDSSKGLAACSDGRLTPIDFPAKYL